jgi:hypothetical protein
MSPTTMTRTSCPSTSPPASRAGGRSLFEPHHGGIPAAGHSLSSQTGKPAGRAIGSQPRGPLETTAKIPQFPRNTQSEPSARRAVVGEALPRPGARRGRTTTATRSTTICGERGTGSMAADRLARGRTRSRPVGRPALSGQRNWSYFMLHAAGSGTRRGLPAESGSRVPNGDESDYSGARHTAQYPHALS